MRVAVQPCSIAIARKNYDKTIARPVAREVLTRHMDGEQRAAFDRLQVDQSSVWGITPGTNGTKPEAWRLLQPGDTALFYRDWGFFRRGRIVLTLRNAALADELWGKHADGQSYEYLYFLDDLRQVSLSLPEYWHYVLGWKITESRGNPIRKFEVLEGVHAEGLLAALDRHTDLPPEAPSEDPKAALGWSDEELRAAVAAYLEMAARLGNDEGVVKSDYYKRLSQRFGRAEGAFARRMQNISYVMSLLGRDWIQGLEPQKHVGVRIASLIEDFIAEAEGKPNAGVVAEAAAVKEAQESPPVKPPEGFKKPAKARTTVVVYQRDPKVKAWVLDRANGDCEACDKPAPFLNADELPFLEVHHLRQLADGGSDTAGNAVATCPNCHRRLHYGADAKDFRKMLYDKIPGLVRE